MEPMPSWPGDRDAGVHRVADVRLRGRAGPLPGRVYWPLPDDAPPRLVVAFGLTDLACRALCGDAGLMLLAVDPDDRADAQAILDWAGDHAHELGAAMDGLLVIGAGRGAEWAAEVRAEAQDEGWPPIADRLPYPIRGIPGGMSNSPWLVRRTGEGPAALVTGTTAQRPPRPNQPARRAQ